MENRKPETGNGKLVNFAGFTFPVFGFLFSIRSLDERRSLRALFIDSTGATS